MKFKFAAVFIVFISAYNFCQVKLQLAPLFADNMVFQQKAKAAVWGKGQPGYKIEIKAAWGRSAKTIVLKDSTWKAYLKTPAAGGSYSVFIKDKTETIHLKNILVGEVWVCSGQSNMEMPLEGWPPKDTILNSAAEISLADYPNIRFFSAKTIASLIPKWDSPGKWEVCTPASAAKFSAVGYFFGKKLFDELKIPVGLIYSGWGGTPAEAWTEKKHLAKFNEFKETLNKIDISVPTVERLRTWLYHFPSIDVADYNRNDLWNSIELNDSHFSKPDFDCSGWETMALPVNWEKTALGEFNGFIWFRKTIELPDDWIGRELTIELGAIDDYDVVYINGIKIGSTEALRKWKENRTYKISPEVNTNKKLSIAVRVHDSGGTGGGIYGGGFEMRLINRENKNEIPLNGEWRYLPAAELFEMKYYVFTNNILEIKNRPKVEFFYNQRTPTALYNGMIAPLTQFSIKGVIWYQGESNTENPVLYQKLFSEMIKNWRKSWGCNFPFYFVQIAPYVYWNGAKSQLLRDAQRKSLSIPNTGMAVTLDLGDSTTVHPANKKPAGERLALQALAKQYRKQIVYSGPLYKSHKIIKNKIELSFEHADSGLEIRENGKGNLFIVAGKDMVFKPAKAEIVNNNILVWSEEVENPVAVRYAWENFTHGVLFNKEGLPASSFRTDE